MVPNKIPLPVVRKDKDKKIWEYHSGYQVHAEDNNNSDFEYLNSIVRADVVNIGQNGVE